MKTIPFSVPTDGATLRVRAAQTDGVPMLLVHGGPGGTDYLTKPFAHTIAHAGYQSIGIIQRGSPGSPSDGPFTIDAMVNDLEAVRAHLGTEKIALLGHSFGGFLASVYAARHPERIERLILLCPAGARAGWRTHFTRNIELRLTPTDRAEYNRLYSEAHRASVPEEREALLVRRSDLGMRVYYSPHHREGKPGLAHLTWRVHENLLQSAEEWYEDATWEEGLERLDCPCAILYGEDDPLPITVVGEYAEMLPDAMVLPLARCGHFPWLEETALFKRAFHDALNY